MPRPARRLLVAANLDAVARIACQEAGWDSWGLAKLAQVRARNDATPLEQTRESAYRGFLLWLREHHRLDEDLEAARGND